MRINLYSELRTLYETTAKDPHTVRVSIKLKDIIDGECLRRAVDTTMARYPYFRVRLVVVGGEPCFEDNPAPVPVFHSNERSVLGSAQTSGHLMCFCHWKNRIHVDFYHGMTDGGGLAPMIKTLLYYYCGDYYGVALSPEGIWRASDVVSQAEWDDPAAIPLKGGRGARVIQKWRRPALQLAEAGIIHETDDSVVYTLRLPEESFMRFNFSNDGSPATVIALLLARAIDALHPNSQVPPVIAMCVNQRKALRAPLAHQSLVGDVRLPYTQTMRHMEFVLQATCFRGMVALQSDDEMVLEDIREYQALVTELKAMDDFRKRQALCIRRKDTLSKCITATISYVGKANLGDAERYVQQMDALPSTALPSTHVPLTLELSAESGNFFLDFIQNFTETDYLMAFIRQLRQNNIEYDVLNTTLARYPKIELPI